MKADKARPLLLASVALLFSANLMAAEMPPANAFGEFGMGSTARPAPDHNDPKLQQGEITGTITSCDEVSKNLSVRDAKGNVVDFSLDSTTTIVDHGAQISFAALHKGDHVSVQYNVEPRRVNRVERLSLSDPMQ